MYYFMEFSTLKPTKLVKISITIIKNQYFYIPLQCYSYQITDIRSELSDACCVRRRRKLNT